MPTKKRPENWNLKIFPVNHDMSKSWFILLEYTDPQTGEMLRKQYRNGINYMKTLAERMKEAKEIVKALELKLLAGWNPFTNMMYSPTVETSYDKLPFNQALDIAMNNKRATLEPKSFADINGVVKFAQAAAIQLRMHLMPVSTVTRKHIKLLLERIGKNRQAAYDRKGKGQKWTGNSYNKYRGFLQIVFSELEDLEAIEHNPCLKIAVRQEITTNVHRHSSEKETELIKRTLQETNMNFFIYLATEYMTGIRPKELFGIKVCDIDWLNQCFDIQATQGRSKTKSFRKVPIPNALIEYLERLRIEWANPDDYIFSTNFKPGPIQMKRRVATDLWKEIVKDGLGLKITLYSFKGLGGEDKRKAGITADAVGSGYGHQSMSMAKRYLHGEGDRINKEIIEKTPKF